MWAVRGYQNIDVKCMNIKKVVERLMSIPSRVTKGIKIKHLTQN